MYVTLGQLAQVPGATELAQVASDEHAASLVDAALMNASLRELPRDAWSQNDRDNADIAVARIVEVIAEVDATIDAHIARRVPALPLLVVPSVLTSIARAMVRYELHKNLVAREGEHPIVRDYKVKTDLLKAIRDGKVTLGLDDPAAATVSGIGDVRFNSASPVFGRNSGVR